MRSFARSDAEVAAFERDRHAAPAARLDTADVAPPAGALEALIVAQPGAAP